MGCSPVKQQQRHRAGREEDELCARAQAAAGDQQGQGASRGRGHGGGHASTSPLRTAARMRLESCALVPSSRRLQAASVSVSWKAAPPARPLAAVGSARKSLPGWAQGEGVARRGGRVDGWAGIGYGEVEGLRCTGGRRAIAGATSLRRRRLRTACASPQQSQPVLARHAALSPGLAAATRAALFLVHARAVRGHAAATRAALRPMHAALHAALCMHAPADLGWSGRSIQSARRPPPRCSQTLRLRQ